MTYRERRASKRFDCSARLDSSAGLEIFRNWIVNLREPDIWTEGGLLVLSGKRICPIINRCTYKIIQLLIAPVDYQCSNFSVFSGSRPSASPSKKQTREMRASPRKPKFPFFHFVFIQFSCFSSFFNWKSYNAWVWHKVENRRWSVLVNQSVNERDGTLATAGAECYGDSIQLLKAVKPGE